MNMKRVVYFATEILLSRLGDPFHDERLCQRSFRTLGTA